MILNRFEVIFLAFLLALHPSLTLQNQNGFAFKLTVTPTSINRYTTNVMTLRCERNSDVQTKMAEIFRIRILKKSGSGWDLVAEQRDNENSPDVVGAVSATAGIQDGISNAFLQVTWDRINDDTFGAFKCVAMGFDVMANSVTENSAEIDVQESKNQNGPGANAKIGDLAKSGDRISRIEKRLNKVSSLLDSLIQWPGGFYALLQPKTGCPVDLAFFGGTHKFHKIHTESQSNPINIHSSAFSRMTRSQDGNNHFFTVEFCEVTRQFNTAEWPQGSFCIHKLYHESCPAGFTQGAVQLDDDDNEQAGEARNNVATSVNNPQFHFCCQNNGSASTPIQLPTSSPFLLYRFGGECQAVQGMTFSQEFLQIDTEDLLNLDNHSGSYPDVDRPAPSLMMFHLCYYTKL
ncbi:hypothetical protein RRG08_041898 [Elysia crispata]|uniref:Apextrin C-terminal domain-containing protein n=1 Tax=Elysia crispata TaxID=231223 RepID=A0AAE1CQP1_9GAST|nr:hypothetical protein RRG08_041898 [Elysia crispata]